MIDNPNKSFDGRKKANQSISAMLIERTTRITALRRPYLYKKRRHPAPPSNPLLPTSSQIAIHSFGRIQPFSISFDSSSTRDQIYTHHIPCLPRKHPPARPSPRPPPRLSMVATKVCRRQHVPDQKVVASVAQLRGGDRMCILIVCRRNGQACHHHGWFIPHRVSFVLIGAVGWPIATTTYTQQPDGQIRT